MKKALVVVALLAAVAVANAEIRIWFTSSAEPYGLTNPALAFQPSAAITSDDNPPDPLLPDYTNNLDVYTGAEIYKVGAFPTYTPGYVPTIDTSKNEFAYIWLQFGPGEVANAFLHQLSIGIQGPGGFTGVKTAYYKVDNLGDSARSGKRWAGPSTEVDNYASFRQNPQLLVAGTPASKLAWGLNNHAPSFAGVQPYNLYNAGGAIGGAGNRIYLLGAVKGDPGTNALYNAFITTFDNEYQLLVDGVVRSPDRKSVV